MTKIKRAEHFTATCVVEHRFEVRTALFLSFLSVFSRDERMAEQLETREDSLEKQHLSKVEMDKLRAAIKTEVSGEWMISERVFLHSIVKAETIEAVLLRFGLSWQGDLSWK